MVIEAILNALKAVITTVFAWVNIPNFDTFYYEDAMLFLETLFSNAKSMINLFLPWEIVRYGIPLIIVVVNFQRIYTFVMWILKKIPMLGIE